MLYLLGSVVLVCAGLFIGWNVQQPRWACRLQDKVGALIVAVIEG